MARQDRIASPPPLGVTVDCPLSYLAHWDVEGTGELTHHEVGSIPVDNQEPSRVTVAGVVLSLARRDGLIEQLRGALQMKPSEVSLCVN